MTTDAAAQHLSVIDGFDRHPGVTVMAGLAQIAAVNMRGVFAGGSCAIVTGNTGLAGRRAVIKVYHGPVGSAVAAAAGQGGGNVVGTLAGRNGAIMTTLTSAQHLVMIDAGQRHPVAGNMAGITGI